MTRPLEDLPADLTVEYGPETIKEYVSTALDVAALIAVCGGVGWGLWPYLGPWAVVIAGVLLSLINLVAGAARQPKTLPPVVEDDPTPEPPPGPQHPGNLHVSGR